MSKFKDWFDKAFAVDNNEDDASANTQETKAQTKSYQKTSEVANKNTLVKNVNKGYGEYQTMNNTMNPSSQKKAPLMKMANTTGAKVHTFEPAGLDDAKKAIEYLNSGYAVLLNLENTDSALSQRIVDVITGALYLLDGNYSIITEDIYLLAPKGVEISSPLETKSSDDEDIEDSANKNSFKFKK
ncbi:MAG: cell division protein SepF [Bacillota bacterium]|nr:cell division protein SepF [Bacillota bacterium]